jgi:hypothetical protein
LSLLGTNPFPNAPPRYVRAVLYRYSFAPPGNSQRSYWNRQRLGLWLPPFSADDPALINYLKSEEWIR